MYICIVAVVGRSEELDTSRIILAEDLCLAPLDQHVEGLEQDIGINSVQLRAPSPIPVHHLVHRQDSALLAGVFNVLLDQPRPALDLAPVHEYDVPAARRGVLGPPVLAHELDELAYVGGRQPAVDLAVVEELQVGRGREGEPEEPVVAGVGEHEGGPAGQLGVAGRQVRLPAEEGREVVGAREAKRLWAGTC